MFGQKQKKLTTTINTEDWKLLKSKNIKPAHILRNFCIKQRSLDAGAFEENIEHLKGINEGVRNKLEKTFKVLGEMLDKEQFDALLEKI